jgi:large conductance mechanosensitive channel
VNINFSGFCLDKFIFRLFRVANQLYFNQHQIRGDKKMKIINEFKTFAMKGNVVDMAVGIIIGAAFSGIVTSLVNDVIMPPIGALIGGIDFSGLKIQIPSPLTPDKPVAILYGKFLNTVINFMIVAFAIFMLVKGMNSIKKKEEEIKTAAPLAPKEEVVLLTQIRDLLKK